MKAILKAQWLSFIRENAVWLFFLLAGYLVISSGWWLVRIDIMPIIYAFAVSPVLAMYRDLENGWKNYAAMACPYKTNVMGRYVILAGYGVAAGLITALVSHDLLTGLTGLLLTMMIPSLCLTVYFMKETSRALLTGMCVFSSLAALPLAVILSALAVSQQAAIHYNGNAELVLNPVISLAIPAGVILLSFLITCFGYRKD